MALDRAKLANIDRRLLADLDREVDWQLVKVPASSATWSTWKRYCDVVGLSMGRAIAALIDLELTSVVDVDVDARAAVITERYRELDLRDQVLAERERELQRREKRLRVRRRPTKVELERMAEQIEPPDPGPAAQHAPEILEPSVFGGVGRNETCPCGSGLKFKKCHLPVLEGRRDGPGEPSSG